MQTGASVSGTPRKVTWWSGQHRTAVAGLVAAPLLLLAGCGADAGDGAAGGRPGGTAVQDPQLAAFQKQCQAGAEQWHDAQLDYPKTLVLRYHESIDYNAAIDARSAPLPPDQVIEVDEGTASAEQVQVQCRIQARLEPVGDHVEVDDNWVAREWSPSGVVEWSWTVAVDEPVDQKVRLQVRPAVLADGSPTYGTTNEISAVTRIDVRAGRVDRTSHWMTQTAPGITTIVVLSAGLLLTLITQAGKVAAALKKLRSALAKDGDRTSSRPAALKTATKKSATKKTATKKTATKAPTRKRAAKNSPARTPAAKRTDAGSP